MCFLALQKGPRNSDVPEASKSWFLNTVPHEKDPGPLGEMTKSRGQAKGELDGSGLSCVKKSKQEFKNDEDMSKEHKNQLKGASAGQF